MKKLLVIAIAFFTLNAVAQQKTVKSNTINKEQRTKQQRNSPEEMARINTKKLTAKLNLSAEQQKKVYNLILESTKDNIKSKSVRKEMISSKKKASKQEFKKARMTNKGDRLDKMNTKFKEILTSEQYEKYNKMNSKNQGQRKKVLVKKN